MPSVNGDLVHVGRNAVGHGFGPRQAPHVEPDRDRKVYQALGAYHLAVGPAAVAAATPWSTKRYKRRLELRSKVVDQATVKVKAKTATVGKAFTIHTMGPRSTATARRVGGKLGAAFHEAGRQIVEEGNYKLSHGPLLATAVPTVAYQQHKTKPERAKLRASVTANRVARADLRNAKAQSRMSKRVTPKQVTGLLSRNRHNIAPPAAGVGLAGAVGVREDHKRRGMSPQRAAGATAAGAAGAGAFYGTGVHLRARAREMDNVNLPGQSSSKRKAARKDHLASFGLHPNQPDIKQQMEANPRIARTWPEELAGAKYRRALGHMSGTRGKLLNAGAIAVPSAAVLAAGNRKGEKVHKAQRQYGYMQTRRSATRTTTLAAGTAVGAWGASRLHLAPAAAAGVRFAESKGHGRAARSAADSLRVGRNAVRTTTGRGEAWLKDRIPGLGTALEPIPAKLRPHAAVAVGGTVAVQSLPTKRRKFVPYGGSS